MKHHAAINVSLTVLYDRIEFARVQVVAALDRVILPDLNAGVAAALSAEAALDEAVCLQRAIRAIHRSSLEDGE